jgi:hypothetical protein
MQTPETQQLASNHSVGNVGERNHQGFEGQKQQSAEEQQRQGSNSGQQQQAQNSYEHGTYDSSGLYLSF